MSYPDWWDWKLEFTPHIRKRMWAGVQRDLSKGDVGQESSCKTWCGGWTMGLGDDASPLSLENHRRAWSRNPNRGSHHGLSSQL